MWGSRSPSTAWVPSQVCAECKKQSYSSGSQVSGSSAFLSTLHSSPELLMLHWGDQTKPYAPEMPFVLISAWAFLMHRWLNTSYAVYPWELECHLLWDTVVPVFVCMCTLYVEGREGRQACLHTHYTLCIFKCQDQYTGEQSALACSLLHYWFCLFSNHFSNCVLHLT